MNFVMSFKEFRFFILIVFSVFPLMCWANLAPIFTKDMGSLALSETTPVGTLIYTLEGYDPEGSPVSYGLIGTDYFQVDSNTGKVILQKPLDREDKDKLTFSVSIKDRVNSSVDSTNDNLVEVPVTVIVLDENDNAPEFQNLPYEVDVLEDSVIGSTIFHNIIVTDKDTVGENLDITCIPDNDDSETCSKFSLKIIESSQNTLKAVVILNETLDYNSRMIYHLNMTASDGILFNSKSLEIRIKDVQNTPPIFQGSTAAVIDEDSPIGTLVLKIQARDGDTGEPRKIVYDLLTNPMDYFLLDSKTGELRTAKPLDKEALPDATGLLTLVIRAREVIDGVPGNDNLTIATTQASVTIKDVNDSPPTFNQNEYKVSLLENTAPDTPLALEMSVSDKDVGSNSIFSLRLNDVSGVFKVEPDIVRGSSQVNIRVGNGSLDYENPNQRKFIVLVIAEETETDPKLSSTATVTITIIDANDNKPVFDQESYSATVSESAEVGQYITTITAKDIDSGNFGDLGIRYSISGTGANYFHVDPLTGVITVADCTEDINKNRTKRENELLFSEDVRFQDVKRSIDVEANGQSGIISVDLSNESDLKYTLINEEQNAQQKLINNKTNNIKIVSQKEQKKTCLDYETEQMYFLSYKATDDEGNGQTSVVSLRISVTDANDSPPVCENPLHRATIDEGTSTFDPPLVVKARDVDTVSDISYSIIGQEDITKIFEIDKRSGLINIKENAVLDSSMDNIYFDVEANDGVFTAICGVIVTIRDVNNHAPQFVRENFVASIPENAEVNTTVEQLVATDLDKGINAEIKYRIQQGSFDDFHIDNKSGLVTVARKLDFDHRNTYKIEVLAIDLGTPSLSGTTTLTVSITNSNDKDPYFTPSTQRAEVRKDAAVGTIIHTLVAIDPDVPNIDALEFAATEPITAIDKDGKEVSDANIYRDVFLIDRSGKVTVNKPLNRDSFAVIRIAVLVTDSTAPTIQQGEGLLIISIIDVNEIPPKFASPWSLSDPVIKLQIPEEQPIGTVLTTLQAYDEDSTIAEYNITGQDYFDINPITGIIVTKHRLDFEQIKEIKFFATVTDTGIPQLTSTAEIIVDIININDNEPYFLQSDYKFDVLENSEEGSFIGKVEANDDDLGIFGELTYSLIGEHSKNFFMNTDSGIITVANRTFLDREEISSVNFTVVAADKAPITTRKTATALVSINIVDVNDNAPIFSQKIYYSSVAENAALNPPAVLLQIVAEDKDDGMFGKVNYFIKSGNEDNLFKLDPNSGILYPSKSLHGNGGQYNLNVEARDGLGAGPFKDEALIMINITSVNQHRPTFVIPAAQNATVELFGDVINTDFLVMTVKAIDEDIGDNGKISYHLQVNSKNVQNTDGFILDELTGELRTGKELYRKMNSTYDLILVARDQGSPSSFETLRFLTVVLIDLNENQPEYPNVSNSYKFSINENGERNSRVGRVQAFSKNKHAKHVYYYIVSGNEDGSFYVEKTSGNIYTNKSLDRELTASYNLYILANNKADLHISEIDKALASIKNHKKDRSIAKVFISILDVNDNAPIFEQDIYYGGVNTKAAVKKHILSVNATDRDYGVNAAIEFIIVASNLYKFGSKKSTGSIVPSPFAISKDGRITTNAYMAEYNQDRFELEIIAQEIQPPERSAKAKVYIWIVDTDQLIRIIISRRPADVHQDLENILVELQNATQKRIVIDEIRYHADTMGRINMEWCDIYIHAIDPSTFEITPVNDILKIIDANYDYLKSYYANFAIENVVPAYTTVTQEEFDLVLTGLVALIIVLAIGAISFIVLCCCLKHWNVPLPVETRRKDTLIKKQIIDDFNTTENPLWIEQKLKLYEEQELTMQVFSEPEPIGNNTEPNEVPMNRRDSFDNTQTGDNTYATIQPRNGQHVTPEVSDYATLRNNSVPSQIYEFTGSTFQAPIRENDDFVTELI